MILVTGGAGYIGSVLVPTLLGRGHSVRVVDRLLFGDRGLATLGSAVDLIVADIRSLDPRVYEGVDTIVHLAGLSNDPMAEFNPAANHAINAAATQTLARAAKAAGVGRFLYASSCSVYDLGLEAEDVLRDERAAVSPRAAYAVSKYDGERAALELASPGFVVSVLRKGTVYGYSPRMRYDLVVNTFVKDAFTRGVLTVFAGGEMWRPLVDVADVAAAYAGLVEAPADAINGEIFNLVYKNYRVLELAHAVREALRPHLDVAIDVRYEPVPVRSYRVAGRKLEDRLHFRPTVSVKDSVTEMVKRIQVEGMTDFMNPRYDNIAWLKLLVAAEDSLKRLGPVL